MMSFFRSFSQSVVTLQVISNDVSYTPEAIYVAGNFNQWQPGNIFYKLQPDKYGKWSIKIKANKDDILEYKFTRGSWDNVEVLANGGDAPNHLLKVSGDTSLTYTIQSWRDKLPQTPQQHTAGSQVQILDTAFYLKALGAQRRLWLYLPKDYSTSGKRYPVLYMPDGQNIFDAATAAYGEWGVDEMLDEYFDKTGKACIVVAIDHGGKTRLTEYNPYNNFNFGKGRGQLFVKSLVESVKPFIDSRFRTLSGPIDTYMAGSSMGGLITMWAVMHYPSVFGGAGILSPSFWMAPQLKSEVGRSLRNYNGKLFFYAGGMEGRNMIPDMDTVISRITLHSKALITRRIENNAGHNEASWKAIFPEFIAWMLGK